MRIILSWAWTDAEGQQHAGGDSVDVGAATAKELIRDGHARAALPDDAQVLDVSTAAETASAAVHENADALASAGDKSPAQPTPKSPDEGDTSEGVS